MGSANPASDRASKPGLLSILWVGLSLSIGWGIRGNFGHEYGAMIPGALAALAAALLSGREDWQRRAAMFAFFGALGWSFGGSMSYMQVIAYTHSGHSGSVLYGFACLFLIGFLWAAIGGAGSALPACLTDEQLAEFFVPLITVFAAWILQDLVIEHWLPTLPEYRHTNPLYWYDTDWVAALVAILAVLGLAVARRRLDSASVLILHVAVGWWLAFLLLVNLLGWRMTPPRGDNWAGCIGMVAGLWVYFQRRGLHGIIFASLLTGLIGGFGFATADLLKLIGIAGGAQTNWHSLLEQSYGFINGVGLAVALVWLARRAPRLATGSALPRWTHTFAAAFVLLIITYVNLRRGPESWVKAKAMPEMLLGLSAGAWFNLAYIGLAAAFLALASAHRRRTIPLLAQTPLVGGQLLYLVFLWWMVLGNFARALVAFAPERLVTEGVIFANALLCTVGILLNVPIGVIEATRAPMPWPRLLGRTFGVGLAATGLCIMAEWGGVRAVYGDRFAGYAGRHIRFGPDATATTQKISPSAPHP
jgi:hypothetical protein